MGRFFLAVGEVVLRRNLLRYGGSRLTVIKVPWHVQERKLPEVEASLKAQGASQGA